MNATTARLGVAALFAGVLVRNAWVSEDAYITFRSIDNWVNGFGLTWNPVERVQTYTHPLWMLCLAGLQGLGADLFQASLAFSLAVSLAALGLLAFGLAGSPAAAVAALLALLSSKAFVDYSASGLEDPLAHLLVGLGLLVVFRDAEASGSEARQRLFWLSLCACASVLNRMDTLLLFVPLLALGVWRVGMARAVGPVALGFLPLVAWEAFALFYYGFPLPNTAYAKLDTGIGGLVLLRHGGWYLWNSLRTDPVTLPAIAAALVAAAWRRDAGERAAALGIALYLAYVVRVGGDFMSGRFLTAPLFCAVALLARRAVGGRTAALVGAAAVSLGLLGTHPPLLSGGDFGLPRDHFGHPGAPGLEAHRDAHGVADERWFYYQSTGLLGGGTRVPEHIWARTGSSARAAAPTVLVLGNIGLVGYYAGPEVTIIDSRALSDPLLARLPVTGDWRIGHFTRELPVGYLESVKTGRNLIQDPRVAELYDALVRVTRGDLLDARRLAEIWKLNTGHYTRRLRNRE